MLEISPLLYAVAAAIDGRRDLPTIADHVTAEMGRRLSADSAGYLIEKKLRPLGIVNVPAGPAPRGPAGIAPPPVLGLGPRRAVVPQRLVQAVTACLWPLFEGPLVVLALAGLTAVDVWLVASGGLALGTEELLYHPALMLMLYGLTALAGAFHELGHATAARYGGAAPGEIGVGLYLIWPAFYNDMNDTYRLDRIGRLRADLGGVYFNAIFILVLAGVYSVSGFEPLIVVIALQHLLILQQGLPLFRLDGYYVLADAIGVPDLFGRIGPVLRNSILGRSTAPAVPALKGPARLAVGAWVLVTVPLMALCLILLALRLPDLVAVGAHSLRLQATNLMGAVRRADFLAGLLAAVQVGILVVPVIGLSGAGVRGARQLRRARRGKPGAGDPKQWGSSPGPAGDDGMLWTRRLLAAALIVALAGVGAVVSG